ncbi:hypothetical protein PQ455_01435 [Sphingomonas naphthae]|uniref:Uncharacterized protein n=1 Tax=Sphingomonas naphthae TaxID=1813468 RepID=A0ABY7TL07_9SPHN|nr:hypothetical protein [Sphingomonas naphthae]WCT73923.1 hypothetical protein PQ455_01435 [Sphingomonas naphthae]
MRSIEAWAASHQDWIAAFSGAGAFAVAVVYLWVEVRLVRNRATPRKPVSASEAKRRAKRENERVKLSATFLNGIGIAAVIATAVIPIFKTIGPHPEPVSWRQALAGVGVGFCFHLFGLWVLSFWRSED